MKENGKEMRCDQNEINQLNRIRRSSTMSMGAWQSLAFAMSKVFESSHSNEESNPSGISVSYHSLPLLTEVMSFRSEDEENQVSDLS